MIGSFQIEKPILGSFSSVFIQSENLFYQINKISPDKNQFEFQIDYISELFERDLHEKCAERNRMRLTNMTKKFLIFSDEIGLLNFEKKIQKYFKNMMNNIRKQRAQMKTYSKRDLSSYLGIRVRKI